MRDTYYHNFVFAIDNNKCCDRLYYGGSLMNLWICKQCETPCVIGFIGVDCPEFCPFLGQYVDWELLEGSDE